MRTVAVRLFDPAVRGAREKPATMFVRIALSAALVGTAAAFAPLMSMDVDRRSVVDAGAVTAAAAPLLRSSPASAAGRGSPNRAPVVCSHPTDCHRSCALSGDHAQQAQDIFVSRWRFVSDSHCLLRDCRSPSLITAGATAVAPTRSTLARWPEARTTRCASRSRAPSFASTRCLSVVSVRLVCLYRSTSGC